MGPTGTDCLCLLIQLGAFLFYRNLGIKNICESDNTVKLEWVPHSQSELSPNCFTHEPFYADDAHRDSPLLFLDLSSRWKFPYPGFLCGVALQLVSVLLLRSTTIGIKKFALVTVKHVWPLTICWCISFSFNIKIDYFSPVVQLILLNLYIKIRKINEKNLI